MKKYRIMRFGHNGQFFVQRKILFWWVDVTEPINEFSDHTPTFYTEDAAERYIREVLCGYLPKPTFVKYVSVNENREEVK